MTHLPFLALLASVMMVRVTCNPGPQWNAWQPQPSPITVFATVTTISISVSTITLCPTGNSHSNHNTTTSPSQTPPTSSRPQTTPQNPFTKPATESSGSLPYSPANDVIYDGNSYIVSGVGSFQTKQEFTFNSTTLPDGLRASDYTVEDTNNGSPYNHKFDPANVSCDGDFLNLKVPAVTNASPGDTISCAEVTTTENNMKYASIRMNVIFSDVPGTCHGMFFYLDDTQECDIEYLTDPTSLSNNANPIPLWLSNQALVEGHKATQATHPPPYDVTTVHEYRIDWVKEYTAFYLDGQLMNKYTTNVPTKAGSWIWNNWSNGDRGWSVGPPTRDNIMRIQNITMYYNTATDASND